MYGHTQPDRRTDTISPVFVQTVPNNSLGLPPPPPKNFFAQLDNQLKMLL